MAVPIAIIHRDIKEGNSKAGKIPSPLNPSDLGTKPLPSTSFHRQTRWCRGQKFYPASNTERGKLMEVDRVNNRINEIENQIDPYLIDYHATRTIGEIYDNKDSQQKPKS